MGFVDLSSLIICLVFNTDSICGLGICLAFGLALLGHEIASSLGFLALLSLILCVG